MAESLHGTEFRVFRCLVRESELESFDRICIEMTQQPPLERQEVAAALAGLRGKGYAEEFKPDHWRHTPNGYGVRRSLLGELPPDS